MRQAARGAKIERMQSVVRCACPHDCPDTCAMHVTVDESGRAVAVAGDPDHPITDGFLCGKVSNYLDRVYSDQRLLHPLIRTGPKGEQGPASFRRASWDEAIAHAAAGIEAAVDRFGGESVLPYSYAGTQGALQGGSMGHRLMNALGASELVRTICATAGIAGTLATHGMSPEVDPELWPRARYVIVWGWNPMSTAPHLWKKLLEARRAGARLVVVDPFRSRTARVADEHLRPLPGTDAALAMGMMRAIVDAGLADEEWCRAHADGYEELLERLAEHPVEHWADLCGVPAEAIERIGTEFARTQPALIRLGVGAQRHLGAPIAYRTGGLPAGAGRRLAPPRRRLLLHPDRDRGRDPERRDRGARTAGRGLAPDQHVAARRGAHRPRPRSAGRRARRLVVEPGAGRPRSGPGAGRPAA